MSYEYDIAFSFAGEDREYVENTFQFLSSYGVRVFYDLAQAPDLLGKNLYQHLAIVYSQKAEYCVVFLSKHYASNLWTKHELKWIQARAFQESREYILPARFDSTEIPGLLPQIAYVDLRRYTPKDFAQLIIKKLHSKVIANHSKECPKDHFDRDLEVQLAKAVIDAEDYLLPHPLFKSDHIASQIRSSFYKKGIEPAIEHILPYINNNKPQYRVVGYLAFNMNPSREVFPHLVNCFVREKKLARQKKETRPYWQLLISISKIVTLTENPLTLADIELIEDVLNDSLEFMKADSSIDLGGQCKKLINELKISFVQLRQQIMR